MNTWTLLSADGQPYESAVPGTLGGHRRARIYGRLDCRAAYVQHRVFFLNEADARAAGYRPCAVCMPQAYAAWKGSMHCG